MMRPLVPAITGLLILTACSSQCATAAYEFSADLIKNVWYYPAHPCDTEKSD